MKNLFLFLITGISVSLSAQANVIKIVSERLFVNMKESSLVAVTTVDEIERSIKMEIFDDPCELLTLSKVGGSSCNTAATKVDEVSSYYSVYTFLQKSKSCQEQYSGLSLSVSDYRIHVNCPSKPYERFYISAYTGKVKYEAVSNIYKIEPSMIRPDIGSPNTLTEDVVIYNSLKSEAQSPSEDVSSLRTTTKKAGRLECEKMETTLGGTLFSVTCKIDGNRIMKIQNSKIAEVVYNSVANDEIKEMMPSLFGFYKQVGRLTCRKLINYSEVQAAPKYTCDLGDQAINETFYKSRSSD